MKRQIAVLLASAMLWSCAGCSGAQDAGNTASTEKRTAKFSIDSVSDDLKNGEKTPAQTEKESRQVPASNTPVAEKETESPLPELTVTRHNLRLDHEDEVIFEGCYDDFALKEESAKAYPALAAAIEDTCSWIPGDVEASLAYTAQYMADYGYESTYEYDTELAITRADRNVVSFCISHESWFGGPHANHYFYPYVFDTKTGEEIPANAIVKDMDALIGAAAERLLNDKALDGLEQDELVDSLQEVLEYSDLPYGLSEDAFLVYLGDYWLGEYDLGWHVVELPFAEYGKLFEEMYTQADDDMNLASGVAYLPEIAEHHDDQTYLTEEYGYEKHTNELFVVENPGWKRYVGESASPTGYETKLTRISTEQYVFAEDWLQNHGMSAPALSRYSDGYTYLPIPDYPATTIELLDDAGNRKTFDFSSFVYPPGLCEGDPFAAYTDESIRYALEDDGVLYVSISHRTYSSAAPATGYLIAVDMENGSVLWMSDPQMANASSFVKIYDNIVCGYGFTGEDDYIYILDAGDGHTVDRIPVATAPEHLTLLGSYLYAACYDTGYVFRYE